jgi:V/A-type H+-transporting ATPase subunit E
VGIDALIEHLEARASAEAESLLEEARAEAEEIRREADRRVERRREEHLARKEHELRESAAGRISDVRREVEEEVLEARAAFLETVFMEAGERLEGEEGVQAFRREMGGALERVLEYVDAERLTLRCRPELAGRARELLSSAGPQARVEEDAEAEVGLVVEAAGGYPRLRDTYLERLRRRRPELAIQLVHAAKEE